MELKTQFINHSEPLRDSPHKPTFYNNDRISAKKAKFITEIVNDIFSKNGSINSDWTFAYKKNAVLVYASYECLDENGKLIDWLSFSVTIDPELNYSLDFFGEKGIFVSMIKMCLENDFYKLSCAKDLECSIHT